MQLVQELRFITLSNYSSFLSKLAQISTSLVNDDKQADVNNIAQLLTDAYFILHPDEKKLTYTIPLHN